MTTLKIRSSKWLKCSKPTIVAIRRHLHAHPELSFQEFTTAKYIATTLRDTNIVCQEGIANTGLVALIQGKKCRQGDGCT